MKKEFRYPDFVDEAKIEVKSDKLFRFFLFVPFKNKGNNYLNVIMKNPSVADKIVNENGETKFKCDKTMRNLCNNANVAGFDGVIVTNLFPFRSQKAKFLFDNYFKDKELFDSSMEKNKKIIEECATERTVLFAWGTNTIRKNHDTQKIYDETICNVLEIVKSCAKETISICNPNSEYPIHPQWWSNDFLKEVLDDNNIVFEKGCDEDIKPHSVLHRNMLGDGIEEENSQVYCRKEESVIIPECENCPFYEGTPMGMEIDCRWEDVVRGDEYVVQHRGRYKEEKRVEELINGPDDIYMEG